MEKGDTVNCHVGKYILKGKLKELKGMNTVVVIEDCEIVVPYEKIVLVEKKK